MTDAAWMGYDASSTGDRVAFSLPLVPMLVLCITNGVVEHLRIAPDGTVTCSDAFTAQEAGAEFAKGIREYVEAVIAERQKPLLAALDVARRAILRAAGDTLWCDDVPAQTVIDRIDAALTAHLQPSLDLAPAKPRCERCQDSGADDYAGFGMDRCACLAGCAGSAA
ncbi:MAG: hypothetical protein QM690_16060 [Sphingobium sp.]